MQTLMRTRVIKINEYLNSINLSLRASAEKLFKDIEYDQVPECVIDFDGIQSMSRSFAQEFLTMMDNSKKRINCVNEPYDISMMFAVVRNPKKKAVIVDQLS